MNEESKGNGFRHDAIKLLYASFIDNIQNSRIILSSKEVHSVRKES